MKNFPITTRKGKTYWVSRSVAGSLFVYKVIDGKEHFLVETRGEGAADFHGKYCACCGYLEFHETVKELMVRELQEEVGMQLPQNYVKLVAVSDSPSNNHENVSIHGIAELTPLNGGDKYDFDLSKADGGEENEIANVEWMSFDDPRVMDDNLWAFGHNKLYVRYLAAMMTGQIHEISLASEY